MIQITGVQVQSMLTGDKRVNQLQIASQFIDTAGPAGVVPRRHDSAAGDSRVPFKSSNVVALPAVDGYGNGRECLDRRFGVDADGCVLFLGAGVIVIVSHMGSEYGETFMRG